MHRPTLHREKVGNLLRSVQIALITVIIVVLIFTVGGAILGGYISLAQSNVNYVCQAPTLIRGTQVKLESHESRLLKAPETAHSSERIISEFRAMLAAEDFVGTYPEAIWLVHEYEASTLFECYFNHPATLGFGLTEHGCIYVKHAEHNVEYAVEWFIGEMLTGCSGTFPET